MNGRYIVIEGNDGTGKSTQVALLAEWFERQGHAVCVVEEPGSDDPEKATPVANELRRVIKNGTVERSPEVNLALFSAARRELWQQKILPALDSGAVVLSSRNYFSTLAYQGYGEGLDVDRILQTTELFTGARYMQPDVAVILLVNDQDRQARLVERGLPTKPDTFELRDDDFQQRVNAGYQEIAKKYGLLTIDASGTVDDVQDSIRRMIDL